MRMVKPALLALGVLGAATVTAGTALAMPNGMPQSDHIAKTEQVRWVCGPYRCWWRPNYYRSYGFYAGPRFGWEPRWHRRWGWRHRHWW